MIQSLRAAMLGVTILGSEVTQLLTSSLPTTGQRPSLTERETEVLRMLCQGASNTQVARSVYLSESTVKNTITALKDKLQAPSRALLIAKALDLFPEMLAD